MFSEARIRAITSSRKALDVVTDLGLTEVEIATGNWSAAPHCDLEALVSSEAARDELTTLLADRGLTLGALNCSGNVLHPISGKEHEDVARKTILLAEQLGVTKIVMMSGLPAVNDGDKVAPWIVTCWPAENGPNLEKQWEKAISFWREFAVFAAEHGIVKIALEMHADQLVWNPPTLLRLRTAVGDIVGTNMDPSHLMWMGADPLACIRALDGAIHHVHAKDTKIEELARTRTRLEPLFFDKREERAWNYVTLGEGWPGGVEFWTDFVRELRASGYDGVLSIEHEDQTYSPTEGLTKAVEVLRESLANA